MSKPHEVVIDGVTYVPAVEAIGKIASLDTMMQAIYEDYMGTSKTRWSDPTAAELWVTVNEDEEGLTLKEMAASMARILEEKQ